MVTLLACFLRTKPFLIQYLYCSTFQEELGGLRMVAPVQNLSRRTFVGGSALLGAALAIGVPVSPAFAVSAAEKQAEADEVRNQLVSLQADMEEASDRYYRALEEKEAAETAMEAEQVKIDAATLRIEEVRGQLGSCVNSMYRTGPTGFLDFVLGATSFEEFTQNWDLLGQLNENDARLVAETRELREELQASRDEYARQEAIASEKAVEAEQILNEANARIAEATELMNALDEEARELLEQEQAAAAAAAAEEAAREQERQRQLERGDNPGQPTRPVGTYDSVVGYALDRKGCPYVWGAEGPDTFDCSGLVRWAYLQIGVSLPHQTESLYAAAANRVPVSEARPGDVLYRPGHVGIAVGYGGVPYVHAPKPGAYVRDTDPLSWSGFTCALQF